ncbi:MAG: hypothetical protein SFY32_12675 [Bacteroidota bacterium]|nr:hypothetical protein [Bacteroidota bacterium]
MKLISILIILIFNSILFSQDIITKNNGEDIKSKVTEISSTEIRYKKFDDPNGPTFVILKSDVLMIRYENGTKDIFSNPNTQNGNTVVPPQNIPQTNNGNNYSYDMYEKGQEDAKKYYNKYKAAGTWSLISGCGIWVSSGLSVIAPVVMAVTEPEDQNLSYPNRELFKNFEYRRGYIDFARKTKNKKIWMNFGIGAGVGCVSIAAFYIAFIAIAIAR